MRDYVDFAARRVFRFTIEPEVEQRLVQEFFGEGPGVYVDVGANEPIHNSQSYHLEQLGWTGVLIEADPEYCNELRKHRTGMVIQMVCSSPDNAGKQLTFKRAGPHSTVEDRPSAPEAVITSTAMVSCDTLDSMIGHAGVRPGFDLLSIDIEGHELAALSGFDFSFWQPQLILLEDHVINLKKHSFMRRKGYRLILRTGLNSWYVRGHESYTFSMGARVERLRKYYVGLPSRKFKYWRMYRS